MALLQDPKKLKEAEHVAEQIAMQVSKLLVYLALSY